MSAGDLPVVKATEEIVAWKGWNLLLTPKGVKLASPSQGSHWDGPVLRSDRVPDPAHNHGIYALKELPKMQLTWAGAFQSQYFNIAYGKVGLSGRVIEGSTGYRAEVATIRELWIRQVDPVLLAGLTCRCELLKALEARYAAEVHLAPDFTERTFAADLLDLDHNPIIRVRFQGKEYELRAESFTTTNDRPVFNSNTSHLIGPATTTATLTFNGTLLP